MRKKSEARPRNDVERDLLDALDRIRNGVPTNPELVKKASRGTLRVSVATVAKEAARSRTLISHDRCAYPAVRSAILAVKPRGESPARTLAEMNRALRHENAELRRTVKMARDSMAAMLLRMHRVEREAERRVDVLQRKYGGKKKIRGMPGESISTDSARVGQRVIPLRKE